MILRDLGERAVAVTVQARRAALAAVDVFGRLDDARFQARIEDPTKRWKLSPMDLESRTRWV